VIQEDGKEQDVLPVFKFQAPKTKIQITSKLKSSNIKTGTPGSVPSP
jgi:hypothetical protein